MGSAPKPAHRLTGEIAEFQVTEPINDKKSKSIRSGENDLKTCTVNSQMYSDKSTKSFSYPCRIAIQT